MPASLIQRGQIVVVHGDKGLPAPPTWGPGAFVLGEGGSLSLSRLQVPATRRPLLMSMSCVRPTVPSGMYARMQCSRMQARARPL